MSTLSKFNQAAITFAQSSKVKGGAVIPLEPVVPPPPPVEPTPTCSTPPSTCSGGGSYQPRNHCQPRTRSYSGCR